MFEEMNTDQLRAVFKVWLYLPDIRLPDYLAQRGMIVSAGYPIAGLSSPARYDCIYRISDRRTI